MTYNISDDQLQQLLDPDMPQCAKEIVAEEIKKINAIPTVESLPPETPDTTRAQMWLLRRIWRWMEMNDNPECLPYEVWKKHSEAYQIVTNKIESIQNELLPEYASRLNQWNNTAEATAYLDQGVARKFGGE